MLKFIARDLSAYRTFFFIMVIIMILYSLLSIRMGAYDGLVGFLLVYLPAMAGGTLFLGDHTLIPQMAAFPVTRKELVLGKYISTYFFGLCMTGIVLIITFCISNLDQRTLLDLKDLLSIKGILFAFTPISIVVSISYPVLFRYGLSLGARIVLGILVLIYGFGLISLESLLKTHFELTRRGLFPVAMQMVKIAEKSYGNWIYVLFILVLVILNLSSLLLSIRWVKRMDF